jgi:hypothetical protein
MLPFIKERRELLSLLITDALFPYTSVRVLGLTLPLCSFFLCSSFFRQSLRKLATEMTDFEQGESRILKYYERDGDIMVPPLNFAMCAPGIYRSGHPNKKNHPFLRKLGLKTIL